MNCGAGACCLMYWRDLGELSCELRGWGVLSHVLERLRRVVL